MVVMYLSDCSWGREICFNSIGGFGVVLVVSFLFGVFLVLVVVSFGGQFVDLVEPLH